jgi:hypothetical protein
MSSLTEKQKADAALHAEYERNTDRLNAIIRPLRTAQYEVDHEWSRITTALQTYGEDYGMLDMNPDFQRGHVWTPDQQQHFIENVLRGVISTAGFLVQFNCPNWEMADDGYQGDLPRGVQCIDGLQRITAVQDFLDGKVRPFGLGVDDLKSSSFSIKSGRFRFRLAMHNFKMRAELLQHYLDLNAGGTPHGASEIDRVRGLLLEAKKGARISSGMSC